MQNTHPLFLYSRHDRVLQIPYMTSSPSLGYTESGPSGGGRGGSGDNDDDDIVCLESFFVNRK